MNSIRRIILPLATLIMGIHHENALAQWSEIEATPYRRVGAQIAFLNDRLFLWGGNGPDQNDAKSQDRASGFQLDLTTNDPWKSAIALPQTRSNGLAATVGNRVYIVGGNYIAQGKWRYTPETLEFDPATGTLTTKASMPVPVSNASGAVVDGRIVVIGGLGVVNGKFGPTALCQIYDPIGDAWSAANNVPSVGTDAAVAAIGSTIYMVGGSQSNIGSATFSSKAYKGNIVTLDSIYWEPIADYPTAISQASAGILNGNLIVVGGLCEQGALATTFIYDNERNVWTPSYTLPIPISLAGPLVGTERAVYIVGGYDNPRVFRLTPADAAPVAQMESDRAAITVTGEEISQARIALRNAGIEPLTATIRIPDDAGEWLRSTTPTLTIQPSDSAFIVLEVDGNALETGKRQTTMTVKTNDALRPDLPLTLTVYVVGQRPLQKTNIVVERAVSYADPSTIKTDSLIENLERAMPGRVVTLSYHSGGLPADSLRIPEGSAMLARLQTVGSPSAAIHRWHYPNEPFMMVDPAKWQQYIDTVIARRPLAPIAIEVENLAFDPRSRELKATVTMTAADALSLPEGTSIRMTAIVTEDSINLRQADRVDGSLVYHDTYYQRHAVRNIWPDVDGIPLGIPAGALDGTFIVPLTTIRQELSMAADVGAPNKSYLTILAHTTVDGNPGPILQALSVPFPAATSSARLFPETIAPQLTIEVAPSPARGSIRVTCMTKGSTPATLSIWSVEGRRIISRSIEQGTHEIDLPTALTAGIYLALLSQDGALTVTRFMVMP